MSTVIVCCKTPNGFTMEVDKKEIKIHGVNSKESIMMVQQGQAVGVTYDVPKDFWEKWLSIHKSHPLNTSGSVFVSESERSAKAQAKEEKDRKTGLEPKTKDELDKVAGATELVNKD